MNECFYLLQVFLGNPQGALLSLATEPGANSCASGQANEITGKNNVTDYETACGAAQITEMNLKSMNWCWHGKNHQNDEKGHLQSTFLHFGI